MIQTKWDSNRRFIAVKITAYIYNKYVIFTTELTHCNIFIHILGKKTNQYEHKHIV